MSITLSQIYSVGILYAKQLSLWRNWLARSTVNREVGGSSPPRDALFLDKFFIFFVPIFYA